MKEQVQNAVKVIHLSNGIPFHSWVIGLPYFFLEPSPEQEAEAADSTKPTVIQ